MNSSNKVPMMSKSVLTCVFFGFFITYVCPICCQYLTQHGQKGCLESILNSILEAKVTTNCCILMLAWLAMQLVDSATECQESH